MQELTCCLLILSSACALACSLALRATVLGSRCAAPFSCISVRALSWSSKG